MTKDPKAKNCQHKGQTFEGQCICCWRARAVDAEAEAELLMQGLKSAVKVIDEVHRKIIQNTVTHRLKSDLKLVPCPPFQGGDSKES